MKALHPLPGQTAQGGRIQPPQRGADTRTHGRRQAAHHGKYLLQLLISQGTAAGDNTYMAHRPVRQVKNALPQHIRRQQRKGFDGGMVMAALRTEAAVHAAIPAAGIDDGTQRNFFAKGGLTQGIGGIQQPFRAQGQQRMSLFRVGNSLTRQHGSSTHTILFLSNML